MRNADTLVIGAGIGGLVAAIELAAAGRSVTVLEATAAAGGKLREVTVGTSALDAGPTVFTMPDVFERLFERAGTRLADELTLERADVLARHFWRDGSCLDLYADSARSAAAIERFAGTTQARLYRAFCRQARLAYDTLDQSFMRAPEPSPQSLAAANGIRGMLDLYRIKPFARLWSVLGEYFPDPRLRQLFGRYATYTGSDPFQATATLILIAHVELAGVWQIQGGMYRLAEALERTARRLGVVFHYHTTVAAIVTEQARARGVVLADGQRLPARQIICNADARALATGQFGADAAQAVSNSLSRQSSLSGLACLLHAQPEGVTLTHHNVFFSDDYAREFTDIFRHHQYPTQPTVYVCAQDRRANDIKASVDRGANDGKERLFCLANAPSTQQLVDNPSDVDAYRQRVFDQMAACGLSLDLSTAVMQTTTPHDFARLFPGSYGALYGQAAHGWRAPFQRPTARSTLAGLYLAGGSIHPGAGLPMAALSGQHAATCAMADDP